MDKAYWQEWQEATRAILEARPKKRVKVKHGNKDFRKDKYRESSGVVFTGTYKFVGRQR